MSSRCFRLLLTGLVLIALALSQPPPGQAVEADSAGQVQDWEGRLEKLRALPYVDLAEIDAEEGQSGVILHRRDRAYQGYNLYCSRFAPEALLLDMEGQVVHRWDLSAGGGKCRCHHVMMLENGDLIVIVEHKLIRRFDWNSNLLWGKDIKAHHDVAQAQDGSIYVISRELYEYRDHKVYFPTLHHLTTQGETIDVWSSFERLSEIKTVLDTRSFIDTIIDSLESGIVPDGRTSQEIAKIRRRSKKAQKLDHFHMNTVSVLPETPLGIVDSRFQAGNLLVCFRNVNQIAVLEKETYVPLWAWGEGQLEWPHHPTMLENGHVLIFDNGVDREHSRVIELDILDQEIVWTYQPDPPDSFYTAGGGSAQRLPNGNTLICETNSGRVFEVSQQGEVVWVWLNPATRQGRRQTVYRMSRHPKTLVDRLLAKEE